MPSPVSHRMVPEVLHGGGGDKGPATAKRLRERPTRIAKNRNTTLRIEPLTGREDMATLISMINSLGEAVNQQQETIREVQEELKEQRAEHQKADQDDRKEHQDNKTELKAIKAIRQDTTVRQPT